MKNVTPNKLADLLDENDYRVVVQLTDRGCMTSFPDRKEDPKLGFSRLYQEFTPTGVLICEYDNSVKELAKGEMECPEYAQRIFTLYKIIIHCMNIGYDIGLIKFSVHDKEVDENTFMSYHNPMKTPDIETTKETRLRQLMGDCFQNGFQPIHDSAAAGECVLRGFKCIRRIFISDDIMNQINEEKNE
jgi:hypothetical protein